MNLVEASAMDRLEAHLLAMPQADIETIHNFYPGSYERKIIIPPWTVLTGAQHKTAYTVRLEQGSIAVNTGDGVKVLKAFCTFHVPVGARRAGRVFETEVIWVDVYDNPDDCTDLKVLEERLYVVPPCDLGENRKAAAIARDRADYLVFLKQLGLSQQTIDVMVNTPDVIPMPPEFDVEVRKSPLHGEGLFATRRFKEGELICPGRLENKRTPAGRFINHSTSPNAAPMGKSDGDIWAIATKPIQANEEILVDYRDSMRVNIGIELERSCQAG